MPTAPVPPTSSDDGPPKGSPVQKPVSFFRSSGEDLRAFPTAARQKAGYRLDSVQRGLTPRGFKPLHGIGSGVAEIKISAPGGDAYRVVYVAKFSEAVYVLDAFQKKSPSGSRLPKNIQDRLERRYDDLTATREQHGLQ